MPHQCTECGHSFPDGSKEMLSGCPECGGNKFQFLPEGASVDPEPDSEPATAEPEPASEPYGSEGSVLSDRDTEDRAQADARSSIVDSAELPSTEPPSKELESESDDGADLSQLREELNDQFESIKIVDHGQYELNLMELYKREEFIIALQENGRYVIEVPESLRRGSDN
ncbi:OapC/ArvC family zinc-ribbon domain-containing protein [Halalkalicoccus salilacus]|uniref:OapC/ArvC family zinc-ribbon domain-containing protein n=1 Tax=Halalkalicoccus salilacus TaxID=3117459 RepID=UPI00300F6274